MILNACLLFRKFGSSNMGENILIILWCGKFRKNYVNLQTI